MLRTKEQYHQSLLKMRPNLYIGGQQVGRDDHRIQPGIKVYDIMFDLAQKPEWKGLATAHSPLIDEEVNRFTLLPQSPNDLMLKQKLIRLVARRSGGCVQRCMGQDGITALGVCTKEIDEAHGTNYHERFLDFMRYVQKNDVTVCTAQTDSKGDRLKRPSQQENPDHYVRVVEKRDDGIVVRGFKMSITTVAYAEEMVVVPTRALLEDDADFAVSFVIPADTEGVRLITRPVWMRDKDAEDASPFCQMGVSDSVIYFDDVFVPNERVLMCGEWEFGRRMALLFANSHRHSYCGCKPAVSDVLCGATLLAAEANNVAKASHVREKLTEYIGVGSLAYAAGVAAALFGHQTSSGIFFPNEVYCNVGRRLMGEVVYHEYQILTEIAGGIAATMPFHEDFKTGENVEALHQFIVRNKKYTPEDSVKIWKFIEDLGTSGMSAWYKIGGVHGGGSPIMETISLNLEVDYQEKLRLARYLAGLDQELDDSKLRAEEPTLGTSLI